MKVLDDDCWQGHLSELAAELNDNVEEWKAVLYEAAVFSSFADWSIALPNEIRS